MHDDNKDNRGEIKYLRRYKQLNSFKNLRLRRNITPTDIDGFIDYNGNAFVYLEGKLENCGTKEGQLKGLERAVDSHTKAGNPSITIIYEYNEKPEDLIDVGNKYVKMIYFKYMWYPPEGELPCKYIVKQIIEAFEKYCEKHNINI